MLICSKKVWDDLPPHVKLWIEEAVADSVVFQRNLWREKTEEALAAVEAAGVGIYHPVKGPFVKATAPLYDQLEDENVRELARRIREVK
jgi:TRAP-type C4-dicarboxylate transport system substrate-binding protein